jgi:hypothetical protein
MKDLVLETIIYELLKEEPKISPKELLNKTEIVYNNTADENFDVSKYNKVVSRLKIAVFVQNYNSHRQ